MVFAVGELLVDLFPDGARIGGAPFNYALHLKRLGIPVRLLSRIGSDDNGRFIRETLARYRFPLEDIQEDPEHATGKVLVEIDKAGVPSFMIVEDVAYDYISADEGSTAALARQAEIIYYGTLAQRSRAGFEAVQSILENRGPSTKCLYDMNLRKGCINEKIIMESVAQCDILKLNVDELKILKLVCGSSLGSDQFIRALMKEYAIGMTSLTRGSRGSTLYMGKKKIRGAAVEIDDVEDTVGAGDAYAAALTLGVLKGLDPVEIIRIATALSSAVCRIRGAIPGDEALYGRIRRFMNIKTGD